MTNLVLPILWPSQITLALSLSHSQVTKKATDGRTLREILHTATSTRRMGWLFNFRKYMQSVPLSHRIHVPVGTTANEQLHRELNHAWDSVHGIHQATLEMKLQIFKIAKLVAHTRAMYNPAVRQSSQRLVLSRVTSTLSPWTVQSWEGWVNEDVEDDHVLTAALTASNKRAAQASALRTWRIKKKPAAQAKQKTATKRTPFSKKTGFREMLAVHKQNRKRQAKS